MNIIYKKFVFFTNKLNKRKWKLRQKCFSFKLLMRLVVLKCVFCFRKYILAINIFATEIERLHYFMKRL